MSRYMEDSNGDTYGNSEVESITTGSFCYRICRICSINWALTKSGEKCSELIGVCDECRKINSLSKSHVKSENFSDIDSSDHSNKKGEDEEDSESCETKLITNSDLHVADNLCEEDKCPDDYDDNQILNINNIPDFSASLINDEHRQVDQTLSINSDVKLTNGGINELLTVNYNIDMLDEHHVNGELSPWLLNAKQMSTTDTSPPFELRIVKVESMALNDNESINACSEDRISMSETSNNIRIETCLNTFLDKCVKLEQENTSLSSQRTSVDAAEMHSLHISPNICVNQDIFNHTVSAHATHCTTNVHNAVSPQNDSDLRGPLQLSVDASQLVSLHNTANRNSPFSAVAPQTTFVDAQQAASDIAQVMEQHSEVQAHVLLTHACSFCHLQFSHRNEMMEHQQLHRPELSKKCGICQETYDTELLLQKHYQRKHFNIVDQVFNCTFCVYSCRPVIHFVSHVRCHTGEKPFVCTQCGKCFITNRQLIFHVKYAHSGVSQQPVSASKDASQQTLIAGTLESTTPQTISTLASATQELVSVSHAVDPYLPSSASEPLTHACAFCFQQFAERREMMEHEQLHRPDPSGKCGICKETFESDFLLQQHCRLKHRDKLSLLYSCSLCLYTTTSLSIFVSHVRLHAGDVPYVCIQCEKRYMDKHMLIAHMKSTHQTGRYCKAFSKQSIDFTSEIETSVSQAIPQCAISATHSVLQEIVDGSLQPISSQVTSTAAYLAQQSLRVSEAGGKYLKTSSHGPLTHACFTCQQLFAGSLEMMEHKQLHRPDPREKCGSCQETFDTELLLQAHCRSNHRNKSSRLYTCSWPMCPYTTSIIRSFVNHTRVHNGEKLYACTQCEYRCNIRQQLTIHVRRAHKNSMNYNKSLSTQSTALASRLVSKLALQAVPQEIVDSSLQPIISQATSTPVALAQQTLSVSDAGDKVSEASSQDPMANACFICLERFAGSVELIKHEKLHRPDPREKCGICQETFDTESLLWRHCRYNYLDELSRLYTCSYPMCPYTTRCISVFVNHARLHSGDRPYVCTQCEHRCISRRGLIQHIRRSHTIMMNYNKKFSVQHTAHASRVNQAILQRTASVNKVVPLSQHTIDNHSHVTALKTAVVLPVTSHQDVPNASKLKCSLPEQRKTDSSSPAVSQQTASSSQAISQEMVDSRLQPTSPMATSTSATIAQSTLNLSVAADKHLETSSHGALTQACSICSQWFDGNLEKIEHEQLHRPDPREKCGICHETFDTESLLWRHCKSIHRDKASQLYTCSLPDCPYTTKGIRRLVNHARWHSGVMPYACTQCEHRCSSRKQLIKHIGRSHQNKNKTFSTQPSAFASRVVVQLAPPAVSQEMIDSRLQPTAPQATSTPVYIAPETEAANQYLKTSSHGPLTYTCSICLQKFAGSVELMEHEQLHRPDPMEKCGICQETFDTEWLLRSHCRCIHRDESSRFYTCSWPMCPYKTKGIREFVSHARLHSGEKPYACTQCTQRLTTRPRLIQHIRHAHQNKTICKKTLTTQPTALASRVHQPDHREKCGICQEAFDTESLLWKHCKTIHRDETSRLYTCSWPMCAFTSKQIRKFVNHACMHIRRSHQNKIKYNKTLSTQLTALAPKVNQVVSHQTTSVTQAVPLPQHTLFHLQQTAVELPVTTHQDVLNAIKLECSLPEQRETDSSSTLYYAPVNENTDDGQHSETCIKIHFTLSNQTTSAPQVISLQKIGISPISLIEHQTVTSNPDEINVIKVDPSLPLKIENESSSAIDDYSVHDDPNNNHLSKTNLEVQYSDLKYCTPDLILCRVDDLYNIDKPCCHQCRVCPKIFQCTTALARHECTHTELTYEGLICNEGSRDRKNSFPCKHCSKEFNFPSKLARHVREVHSSTKLTKCYKCSKSLKNVSMHICTQNCVPRCSHNMQAINGCSSCSNNNNCQDKDKNQSPTMHERVPEMKHTYTAQVQIANSSEYPEFCRKDA